MKKILTLISCVMSIQIADAQIQDVAAQNSRFAFYPVQTNNATSIAAAGIALEKIYWQDAQNKTTKPAVLQTINTYDANGRMIASETGSGNNKKTITYQYSFGEDGKLATKKVTAAIGKGSVYITEIAYNENGAEATCSVSNSDASFVMTMKKEYGKDGNCTGISFYDSENNQWAPLRSYAFTGDSLQAVKQFLGASNYYTLFFKNMNGNEQVFKNDDWLASFSYDNSGRCVEEKRLIRVPASGVVFNDMAMTVSSNNYSSVFYQESSLSIPAVEQTNAFRNTISSGNVYGDNAESVIPSGDTRNYSINYTSSGVRTGTAKIQTLQHSYNADGTLAETKIFVADELAGSLQHVYEMK